MRMLSALQLPIVDSISVF